MVDFVVAYEADPLMFNFLKQVRKCYRLKEIELMKGVTPDTEFKQVDLAICMNVHMWLVKQFGREKSSEIVSNLIKNSKTTFFQTASRDSNGRYRVKWLKDRATVSAFLKEISGYKEVTHMKTLRRRHLFKIGE